MNILIKYKIPDLCNEILFKVSVSRYNFSILGDKNETLKALCII